MSYNEAQVSLTLVDCSANCVLIIKCGHDKKAEHLYVGLMISDYWILHVPIPTAVRPKLPLGKTIKNKLSAAMYGSTVSDISTATETSVWYCSESHHP
eukprot:5508537-Amphidinium_carterae.1